MAPASHVESQYELYLWPGLHDDDKSYPSYHYSHYFAIATSTATTMISRVPKRKSHAGIRERRAIECRPFVCSPLALAAVMSWTSLFKHMYRAISFRVDLSCNAP